MWKKLCFTQNRSKNFVDFSKTSCLSVKQKGFSWDDMRKSCGKPLDFFSDSRIDERSFHSPLWRDEKSFPPKNSEIFSTTTRSAAPISGFSAFWQVFPHFRRETWSFPRIIHRISPVLPHDPAAQNFTNPLSHIDNSFFHSFHPLYGYYFWYSQVFSGKVSCCQTRVRACINPRLLSDWGLSPCINPDSFAYTEPPYPWRFFPEKPAFSQFDGFYSKNSP